MPNGNSVNHSSQKVGYWNKLQINVCQQTLPIYIHVNADIEDLIHKTIHSLQNQDRLLKVIQYSEIHPTLAPEESWKAFGPFKTRNVIMISLNSWTFDHQRRNQSSVVCDVMSSSSWFTAKTRLCQCVWTEFCFCFEFLLCCVVTGGGEGR